MSLYFSAVNIETDESLTEEELMKIISESPKDKDGYILLPDNIKVAYMQRNEMNEIARVGCQ